MLSTVLLAAALAAALWLVVQTWQRRAASRRARARARRALAGETAAEALLERAGYAIVDRQARTVWTFFCDDDPVEAELRCDLLVEHDGRLLVAEVKTGQLAPRLDTAATRRQLLEYQLAYGADGVVLVDAETGTVRVIDFPMPMVVADEARHSGVPVLTALAIGTVVGSLMTLLLSS